MPPDPARSLLLPSVLDRLTDPAALAGAAGGGLRAVVESVRRDLEHLLNTRRNADPDIDRFPELSRSVFAYGMPELVSRPAASGPDRQALGRLIADAVGRHEPRVRNVRVTLLSAADTTDRQLRFRVEGTLRIDPAPAVEFETVLELATGQATVAAGAV